MAVQPCLPITSEPQFTDFLIEDLAQLDDSVTILLKPPTLITLLHSVSLQLLTESAHSRFKFLMLAPLIAKPLNVAKSSPCTFTVSRRLACLIDTGKNLSRIGLPFQIARGFCELFAESIYLVCPLRKSVFILFEKHSSFFSLSRDPGNGGIMVRPEPRARTRRLRLSTEKALTWLKIAVGNRLKASGTDTELKTGDGIVSIGLALGSLRVKFELRE
ncbi:hypothetical protein MB27_24090 [Actinoplanes utahensis]|uniref:Uncharacterized protein n=1 Tax=Actinoplanes utahensis TaxID=1869 RepID=A0A0A6UJC4_ACTUT|nr:hypothetical protein MB27_24090 [Actinoplanes utahensis]